jgi:hypothetical protein
MRANKISRRRFLKETLLGTAFLSTARFLPSAAVAAEALTRIPDTLLYFSPKEFLIFEAIADRIIGASPTGLPGSADVGVAARADQFLHRADPEIQEQFHQLLTVFNAPLFTFLFDFRFSSFLSMSPEDKDSYLEDWMTSVLGIRRTGFQALKRICMSMFYTHRSSWSEIGYEGMFMPEDRK